MKIIPIITTLLAVLAPLAYGGTETTSQTRTAKPAGTTSESKTKVQTPKEVADDLRERLNEGLWQAIEDMDNPSREQILQARADYLVQHREEYAQLIVLDRKQIVARRLQVLKIKASRSEISQEKLTAATQKHAQKNDEVLLLEAEAHLDKQISTADLAIAIEQAEQSSNQE